jgi:hypothetical protein
MGSEIALRCAAVIHAEYKALKPVLDAIKPRRIADIGCGYAMFDLFAARDYKADLMLIDLESNERRHFGFQEQGAAYSSLSVAKAFLTDNGIKATKVATFNPETAQFDDAKPVDLAVSFLSCGFHYPIGTYLPFFRSTVTARGAIIVDLRAASADEQIKDLQSLGTIVDLDAPPKARRVHVSKTGG